jgi:hypothetical protein
MNPLLDRAVAFLDEVYDSELGLFPASTSLVDGRYVSTFDEPGALRYSINSLLGLKRAAQTGVDSPLARDVDDLVERFLDRNYARVGNYGDLGLLLVLLADSFEAGPAEDALRRIGEVATADGAAALPLQEVCWMLWGATALARYEVDGSTAVASNLFRILHRDFLNRDSLLPHHTKRLWRRNSVSFGGVVYFLRALHEYADCFGDEYAESLFRYGVGRVLDLQGSRGEWPWMIDVSTAAVIDLYPVYSVHQDSMSMLFLLPALDRGLAGVRDSIERSYSWVLGQNEISTSMIHEAPFFRYRSLERRGGLQRPRRYVRSLPGIVRFSRRYPANARGVRINRECRSYEMGWVVYVWAGRPERLSLSIREHPVEFA